MSNSRADGLRLLVYAGGGEVSAWREALARHLPGVTVTTWPSDAVADYLAVWQPPRALIEAHRDARAVFSLGAGVDHMLPVMSELGSTRLVRVEDAGMADQMVEYALLVTLMVQRRWRTYAQQRDHRRWERHSALPRASVTVGVLGLGALGGAVARALAGFGYSVRGWTRRPRAVPGVAVYSGDTALHDCLSACDVLINMLPLTPATRGLLDRRVLSMLPSGAVLVNLARGDHVVEADVLELLDAGHLGCAYLDVFRDEPLPEESPLWQHPRVIVTPHIAALSLHDASAQQIAEKIRRIERGEAVTGEVDLDAGY